MKFISEISKDVLVDSKKPHRSGYYWEAFDVSSKEIAEDKTHRFDYKYWDLGVREAMRDLAAKIENRLVSDLNQIPTIRGKSPAAENYVDADEGYAMVIKSGSSISKQGKIITENSDWIEKSIYDEFVEQAREHKSNLNLLKGGDILLSSTGDGTLGKCCVFDLEIPAIADGHITIIRVDPKKIDPYYLCDYL